ncbi:m7GpppN-mRNA hydrolase [Lutzomyia longipalpis]|uniref:m7GpppN-mRNA hydrolase n=1 Tax=Lutzomyia longipalpis TaxID=7200 RepID=UPI00248346CF|nr:m7GpppN-mRNA hydrolase [Lutzomyia longipalpis]
MSAAKSALQIDEEFLDDLASRFIINVPVEERANLIRICFQVELAHWFYLDFYCGGEDYRGVSCTLKQFATQIFQHVPFLRVRLPHLDEILDNWKKYKLSVPTYGAILISDDLSQVLLVQSYWAKSSWGFPKGKVNENEDPVHCAVREVFEETGFDISHLIQAADFFESTFNDQFTRLYVVSNVPKDTVFTPRTRNEIKCCVWFPIDLLPNSKTEVDTKQTVGFNANSFFMIMPFMKRLKKWVHSRREEVLARKAGKSQQPSNSKGEKKRQRHKSMGEIENLWIGDGGSGVHKMSGGSLLNNPGGGNKGTPMGHNWEPKRRDKAPKTNPKRQLFGSDATATSTPDTSPAVLSRNTPIIAAKNKTKITDSSSSKKPNPRPQFVVTPCWEWDNFRFDIARICDSHNNL